MTFRLRAAALAPALHAIALSGQVTYAQEPVRSLSQLYHTAWTIRDGAPADVSALAQTADGYLWLGGSAGLFRFDGIRFVRYQPEGADAKAMVNVTRLLATRDGRLWVGYTSGGVSVIARDTVRHYTTEDGVPTGPVYALAQDSTGAIWVGTTIGLGKFEGGRWKRVGSEVGFTNPEASGLAEVWSMIVDRRGQVWVSAGAGIFRRRRDADHLELVERKPTLKSGGWNQFLAEATDGTIWASDRRGLRIVDPVARDSGTPLVTPNASDGICTMFDRTAAIWVALRDGLERIVPGVRPTFPARERLDRESGLSGGEVRALLEDREGNVWVATSGGLDRFRRSKLTRAELPPGARGPFPIAAGDSGSVWIGPSTHPPMRIGRQLTNAAGVQPRVDAAYADAEGTIWFGGDRGLWQSTATGFARVPLPPVQFITVQAIVRDASGHLWVSLTRRDSAVIRREADRWVVMSGRAGLPPVMAFTMATDDSGRVWLGYYLRKAVAVWSNGKAREFGEKEGLRVGSVFVVHTRGEHVWVGGEQGLALLSGDHFRAVKSNDGPAFGMITGIVELPNGDLWVHGTFGIARVSAAEIRRTIADTTHRVAAEWLNYRDGFDGAPSAGPEPSMIEGSDGRLWFATNLDVASLDPNRLLRNPLAPPVVIERLTTGDRSFMISKDLRLPVHARSLRIEFTALSLSIPERVRFRYQLIGSDEGWQESGGRREASYTNLGPGSYRFRVIAANEDGVWNESGATLDFTIPPSFTESRWFVALWVSALAGLVWLAIRLRMRRVDAGLRARYAAALAERTRIAQELHDTLLQGFTGITIRLRAIQRVMQRAPNEGSAALETVLASADTALRDARNAIWDMRAVELEGRDLPEALEGAVRSVMAGTSVPLEFTVRGDRRPLSPLVETTALRIGREAVLNALKHAEASHIEVRLEYASRRLNLEVADDGRGITPDAAEVAASDGHLGIAGMRARVSRAAGAMDITTRPGAGTIIRVTLPLD